MGIVQKQGISIAFVSFVGVVIGALNTMFVFPNVLGAERHGLVMLIFVFSNSYCSICSPWCAKYNHTFFSLFKRC